MSPEDDLGPPTGNDAALTREELLERERTIAIHVAGSALDLVENLAKVSRSGAAKMSRVLWPRGAPRIVSWHDVHAALLARLDRSMDDIVRADMAQRGGSVRPETLMRMQVTKDAQSRFQRAQGRPELDGILENVVLAEGRRTLGDLVELSLGIVARTATTIAERDGRAGSVELGKTAVVYLLEITRGLAACADAIGWKREADALATLVTTLAQMRTSLDAERASGEEPAPIEPRTQDVAPSVPTVSAPIASMPCPADVDAAVARLARIGVLVRRLAMAVADAIDAQLFAGAPPERVTWCTVHDAISEDAGTPMAERAEGLDALEACDAMLVPRDDAPFSTRELTEATATAIESAVALLRAASAADREEAAEAMIAQCTIMALELVLAAQLCGLALIAAPLAVELGLDPVPLPENIAPVGTA